MAINFPSSPSLYQIHSSGGSSFIWNGTQWVGYSTSLTVNYNASSVLVADNNTVSGATTTINFGDNLSVLYSSGIATITGSASGGGGTSSQWVTVAAGIHTSSNVGIGTTNPTEKLTVSGDARVTGILTVGSSSITLNGLSNVINVGTGITINGNSGIISATSIVLGGTTIIGSAVTSITAGSGISINQSTGNVTITATGGGGGTSSQWITATSGIHTSSNVGIGTTNPTSKLTVSGNGNFIGILTALSFSGSGTSLTGIVTSITAGFGISITQSTGNVTITATGGSGGTSSQWVTVAAGIHTTSNIGIGTTNPTSALTVFGDSFYTGVITATKFVGDGSGLTGVVGSGSGVAIYDDTSLVGTAQTIVFGNNLTVSSISAGVVTVTASGGATGEYADVAGIATYATNAGIATYATNAGISTVSQNLTGSPDITVSSINSSGVTTTSRLNVGIGGTIITTTSSGLVGIGTTNPTGALTVKGNTSLETLNVSGVSTVNSLSLGKLTDLLNLNSGDNSFPNISNVINVGGDMTIFHLNDATFGTSNRIIVNENDLIIGTKGESGGTYYSDLIIVGTGNDENYPNTSYVALGYGDAELKLETIGAGITIYGTTFTNQLSVSGIATIGTGVTIYGNSGIVSATTFYGNLVGSITNATNLTGGTANASTLNVSGLATISQGRIQADAGANLRFGNLPAGSGSGRNIAIGDQVLVSLSGGQGRNIGIGELSYYDTTTGQYNIGIGERAGQKVSTGSYNVILGSYDGNSGNLDIRTSSNNVVIADGQGNIRQYINSSGNVGIKTTVITEALTVAGIVSATGFYGTLNASQLTGSLPAIDGSALTGVVATGTGIEIREDDTPIGTANTINFGNNVNVTFASGIATVSASIVGINTSGISRFNQLNVSGISTFQNDINLNGGDLIFNSPADRIIFTPSSETGSSAMINLAVRSNQYASIDGSNSGTLYIWNNDGSTNHIEHRCPTHSWLDYSTKYYALFNSGSVKLYHPGTAGGILDQKFETIGAGVTITGTTFTNQLNVSGIATASSFSGSASGLTNIPAGQLTGNLPAIDGSALLNVNATGSGIVVLDDNANVGSARTVNFGTGLDVTYSTTGIATITASGGSLQSRTTVTGVTTSIANNGIGNTNITGFKSYALMKVGLSTTGWLRLYTDSASRDADVYRSVGEDPAPGSGVIAEVITTGISTTQIISPFVMGGNLNNPADTTIYTAITNLSGSTQTITANLTILQLEA